MVGPLGVEGERSQPPRLLGRVSLRSVAAAEGPKASDSRWGAEGTGAPEGTRGLTARVRLARKESPPGRMKATAEGAARRGAERKVRRWGWFSDSTG